MVWILREISYTTVWKYIHYYRKNIQSTLPVNVQYNFHAKDFQLFVSAYIKFLSCTFKFTNTYRSKHVFKVT